MSLYSYDHYKLFQITSAYDANAENKSWISNIFSFAVMLLKKHTYRPHIKNVIFWFLKSINASKSLIWIIDPKIKESKKDCQF